MGKFRIFLKGEHSLKLPWKAERFCGINIPREGNSIRLKQEDDILRRAKEFGYENSKVFGLK